jgi:dolichol-phosphate mannosyltransferase
MKRDIDCSIVIPVYFNEGSLIPLIETIKTEVVTVNSQYSFEIIFVDDGSGDNSLNELLAIRQENSELVKVLKLTRNFGQLNALLAGFSKASGKCVVMMSADGQDPAKLINEMLSAHFNGGSEVVICAREGRDESAYRVYTSKVFYYLMKKMSFSNMPPGGFDFVLMGRNVVNSILRNAEPHMFLQGEILWTGYKPHFIYYQREARKTGESKWTFGKKLTYLIDGLMSFSFLPIRLISLMGIITALLGFMYALVVLVSRLVFGNPTEGWAPLMIVILVMGGMQMIMLGVIGEYLWRALAQVRKRDLYVIEETYELVGREDTL